jgi:hypothetical protein
MLYYFCNKCHYRFEYNDDSIVHTLRQHMLRHRKNETIPSDKLFELFTVKKGVSYNRLDRIREQHVRRI